MNIFPHAIKRARERYEIDLTLELQGQLVNKALSKGIPVNNGEQGANRRALSIEHEGKTLWLVVDERLRKIVTFLHPNQEQLIEGFIGVSEEVIEQVRVDEERTLEERSRWCGK